MPKVNSQEANSSLVPVGKIGSKENGGLGGAEIRNQIEWRNMDCKGGLVMKHY